MHKKVKKQVVFNYGVHVPEKFVNKDILKDFEHRLINYYGGGEKNIDWDYYDPEESDLVIKGYKYLSAKKEYVFYTGRRDLLNKHFSDFDIIDERSRVPWSKWSTEHIQLRKNFHLKESQVEMVDQWMHKKYGIIKAPARSGKCVVGNSLVITTEGIIPIRKLCSECFEEDSTSKIEKRIINYEGFIEKSTAAYRGFDSKTIEIQTSFGYSIRGTEVHPVMVLNKNLELEWKKLKDIDEGDIIAIHHGEDIWSSDYVKTPFEYNFYHNSDVISFPKIVDKNMATLLGYLVSEGTIYRNGFTFTNKDKRVMNEFIEVFEKIFPEVNYRVKDEKGNGVLEFNAHSCGMMSYFKKYGLRQGHSKRRNIPWCILQSPREIIIEFLRCYFEGDGCVGDGYVGCTSASKRLINELQTVLANFGIITKKRSKKIALQNSIGTYYTLDITNQFVRRFRDIIGFKYKSTKRLRKSDKVMYEYLPYSGENNVKYLTGKKWYKGKQLKLVLNNHDNSIAGGIRHPIDLYESYIYDNIKKVAPEYYEKLDKILPLCYNTFWDKVSFKKIHNNKSKVYDIMVPRTHSFVVNSIVSHNTVIMSYITFKLKQKTLIIANQRELLVQWKKEFSNVVTNCGDVATEKHPVVGILNKWSDIDKYDIVLSTWQVWNRNPKKIHKYRSTFGLIFVDEIHRCNADCPKNVISQFNAKYKGGVTATVERKDGRQYYMDFIIGPVTSTVETEQMKCKVCKVKTGLPIKMCMWTYYINRLCNSPERNKMIIKLAKRLAKQGRYVVIGSDRTEHIKRLTERLQRIGVKAAAFYSGCPDRANLLDKAKKGKIQVFVANRSMLTGINVPCWDCFMNILPINNPPTFYQHFSRIRTPMKGKPMPSIYDFVDEDGVSIGLFQKRCKQYKEEGFLFIPSINGDLKIDEAKEEENASLSHWKRRMANRSKAKPFFNGPTAHKDGVAVSSIFD